MQYDLNGKPILRVNECKHMVTQKNGDGTTTLWRNGVMYKIPSGDPDGHDVIAHAERQERIEKMDYACRYGWR